MTFTYESNSKAVMNAIRNAERRALRAAGTMLRGKIRDEIVRKGLVKKGVLKKSVKSRVSAKRGKAPVLRIGVTAPHSHFIELGTSKMDKDPFLFPTIRDNRPAAKEIIQNYIADFMKGIQTGSQGGDSE